MKKLIVITAALTLSATALAAQDSKLDAAAESASQSQAVAGNNLVFQSGGKSEVEYSGSYEIENVPAVTAPGVITAHNCALGASGGAAATGFGVSFGGSYVDEECQLINEAAALNTLAGAKVALRHLAAGNPDICKTLRDTGKIDRRSLCTEDEKKAAAKAQPTVSTRNASAPTTVAVMYSKCSYDEASNKVTFKAKRSSQSAMAKAQCMQSLGF